MLQLSQAVKDAIYSEDRARIAECFTLWLSNGADVRRWTSAGLDVTWGGVTWLTGQCGIRRGKIQRWGDSKPDTLKLTLSDGGAVPVVQYALGTSLDRARVRFERVYFDSEGAPVGSTLEFDGWVLENKPEDTTVELSVESVLSIAPSKVPVRALEAKCVLRVYSAECGAAVIQATATVAAGSTTSTVRLVSVPGAAAVGSWVTFTSGPLAGVTAQVASITANDVLLDSPLASAPAAGVTVSVKRACDKSFATCKTVFGNGPRFAGTPYAPVKQPGE